MVDMVSNTELSTDSKSAFSPSIDSFTGDRPTLTPNENQNTVEQQGAVNVGPNVQPQNANIEADFQACYERFLNRSSSADIPGSSRNLSAAPPVDPATALKDFQAHYEKFVGYSVDPRWFSLSDDSSRYQRSSEPSGFSHVLRTGMMAIGSLVATGIVGALLLKAGSDGPQFTYREYSPDLFEQSDFEAAPRLHEAEVNTQQSPSLSEAKQTPDAQLQSLASDPAVIRRMPTYQVTMPDWSTPIGVSDPTTFWPNHDAPITTASITTPQTVPSETVATYPATLSPSDVAPSQASAEAVEPSSTVAPLPVIPPALTEGKVEINRAIAFQPFAETGNEVSAESAKTIGLEASKQDQLSESLSSIVEQLDK